MDPQLEELYGTLHRIQFNDQKVPILPNNNVVNTVRLQDSNVNLRFANPELIPQNPDFNLVVPSVGQGRQESELSIHEDYDFSDVVLKYINQVLMEEDEEERSHVYHEPSALEAAEKTLYEVIGKQYPSPHDQYKLPDVKLDSWNTSGVSDGWNTNGVSDRITDSYNYSAACSSSDVVDSKWSINHFGYNPVRTIDFSVPSVNPSLRPSYISSNSKGRQYDSMLLNYEPSFSSASSAIGIADATAQSPVSALNVSELFNDSQSMLQFQKGLDEASKFLPKAFLYKGVTNHASSKKLEGASPNDSAVHLENKHSNKTPESMMSGKKHHSRDGLQSEERRENKQSAVTHISDEAVVRSEMWDKVLLCSGGKNDAALREALQSEKNKNTEIAQAKESSSGRGRGKRKGSKREVVDLRSLLSLCAQAVGSNDQRSANDLLKKIRQHSSPTGDGNQRMAHYFADGLEARLAGVGTPIYSCLLTGPANAVDILRGYHMFLAVCPFKKIGNFFSNRTITEVAAKATRLHIIDIGIVYGFQWPCLFQLLSSRPGGPPKIRITGVDNPQPGFRPAKRVEETGQRLKNYAESFNIPFEFNAVAKKWETLTIEDLKIDSDEVLVVNSMFRLKYIPEETAMVECPRDMVLNLVRQIKPAVFIQGAVNGAFNSPFFITRFREALFHFSTLFDLLETNLPRDLQERILVEREIFGRQAMNVIACEGFERIERPETYKQWQVRNERIGFRQLPLNPEIVSMAKKRVKSVYHKDFSIDEDGHWLLLGWKGRIVYALTTWDPVSEDILGANDE
ncbi:scarecrow-like protein 33 [Beta vulgaris subsp. vulgaris]|uniref:scarecrow-like protein 33 n=1 Tax=Beta vulgaris subsp. vulgaris TaxID=3555 RepID=UPI002036868C|nr:scarecrow-like protein 33 [Beta vulgaris subsp. vulgaris]XP_048495546.1 scarecrow-like protein 33 [Beta vulgaris subsp. vulgaris]